MSNGWEQIVIDDTMVENEELTPKGNGIIVTLKDGKKLLLTKQRMKNWRTLNRPVCASIIKSDKTDNLYNVGILSSLDFTAIPHRVLFNFVENTLKELGIKIASKEWRKWFKRTGMFFNIREIPLVYARSGDALRVGILATNANTTEDSIRIFPFSEIALCRNGLANLNTLNAFYIIHRGDLNEILKKVRESVIKSINALPSVSSYAQKLCKLQDISMKPEDIENRLKEVNKFLPYKSIGYLHRGIQESTQQFGYTALAIVQALSRLYSYPETPEEIQKKMIKFTNEFIDSMFSADQLEEFESES